MDLLDISLLKEKVTLHSVFTSSKAAIITQLTITVIVRYMLDQRLVVVVACGIAIDLLHTKFVPSLSFFSNFA